MPAALAGTQDPDQGLQQFVSQSSWDDAPVVRRHRALLRERADEPSAVAKHARTFQSSPESGARAGDDGCQRRQGRKAHVAVATLGTLLAVTVTPANEQERPQVGKLAVQVQAATGHHAELADVDPDEYDRLSPSNAI